jgi:hypothetical protein
MSFVSVLSEGFDHPPIDAVVLMRPMRSPVLYVQTVGRGLRPAEGKKDCLVLDYGQVVRTIGPLDDPSIAKGGGMRERDGQLKLVPEIPQLECQACRAFTRAPAKACGECGAEFPPPPAPSQKIDLRAGGGDILSSDKAPPAPVTQTLGPVVVSPHTAKSGNQCVKIHYQDGAVMSRHGWGGGVYEFFVCSNPWAMDRLEQRLERIGIDLPDTDGSHVFPGTFEVTTLREGKYDRVKDVRRTSPANPGSAVGFGDDEEEENADFPFGYNNQTPRGIGF